jgi:DNA polymerase/3'-5' exonuclease PolX
MSSGPKRQLIDAVRDAEQFRKLFADTYDNWVFAGSVRRAAHEVGDVEHVVLAKSVEAPAGLFTEDVNAVWRRADQLVTEKRLRRALYGKEQTERWGERLRGCNFLGWQHEIYCADVNNFGLILLIRTGPAAFSKQVVEALRARGTPSDKGYVHQGTDDGPIIPCPDEETVFRLAGMPFVAANKRAVPA